MKKYLRGRNFWSLQVDNNASTTWKGILLTKDTIMPALSRAIIVNGRTTLWFDNWLAHGRLVDRFGWQAFTIYNEDWQVLSILNNKQWNPISARITTPSSRGGGEDPIADDREEDYWVWTLSNTRLFSFKSAYALSREFLLQWNGMMYSGILDTVLKYPTVLIRSSREGSKQRISYPLAPSLTVPVYCVKGGDTLHLFFGC